MEANILLVNATAYILFQGRRDFSRSRIISKHTVGIEDLFHTLYETTFLHFVK